MRGSMYRLEAKNPLLGRRPQFPQIPPGIISFDFSQKMTIWDSLLCGASHTLDGEASAQHNSEQDRENEKDGHEGGREVETYEEKEEDEDERPCGD